MLNYTPMPWTPQGQESRKVTDLCQAMADAGLDGSTITMSIEEEYALMDLPISAH